MLFAVTFYFCTLLLFTRNPLLRALRARYLSLFWSPRRPIHVCRGRLRFPPLFTAAPVPTFYQLPSLVAAATHHALGAPVICHCAHRTPSSEPQLFIPPRTHRFKITVRQNSQLSQENRPFSCYDLIQADNRRLQQTCLTPLGNGNIHTSLTQPARYSADDGIFTKIKNHQCRSYFRSNTIRVGKTAKINLAEHRYWAGASES